MQRFWHSPGVIGSSVSAVIRLRPSIVHQLVSDVYLIHSEKKRNVFLRKLKSNGFDQSPHSLVLKKRIAAPGTRSQIVMSKIFCSLVRVV